MRSYDVVQPGGDPVVSTATEQVPPDHPVPPENPTKATMADSNFAATPYPTYNLGGDDDSVQHAILTSHAGASVERNQDAGFAAGRAQLVNRDVVGVGKDGQIVTLESKFDLAMHLKDAERRAESRLARIEAKLDGAEIGRLSRDLAEANASARADKSDALLARLVAKLGA